MQYSGDLGIILYLTSIIIPLVLAFALCVKPQITLPQKYLAVSFVVSAFSMLFCFIYDRYFVFGKENIRAIEFSMTAFGGISILLYLISLMRPDKLNRKTLCICFICAVLFSLLMFISEYFWGTPSPESIDEVIYNLWSPGIIYRLVAILANVVFLIYIATTVIRMYSAHKQYILEQYSYRENIDLKWIIIYMAIYAFIGFITLLRNIDNGVPMKVIFNVSFITLMPIVYYFGSRQDVTPVVINDPDNDIAVPDNKILPVPSVAGEKSMEEALVEYFTKELPFLNQDLNLSNVAEALNTNTTYLSRFLNGELNVNFYDFVNSYRIDYAISLLHNSEGNYASKALIGDSGFKSKAVFYKKFRDKTKMSPQEYASTIILNKKSTP